jgi:hypothetical protein
MHDTFNLNTFSWKAMQLTAPRSVSSLRIPTTSNLQLRALPARSLIFGLVRCSRDSVNEGIELHDSELAAVDSRDGSVHLTLSPAYIHRGGSGWLQDATLTIRGAGSAPSIADLPAAIWEGSLRVGDDCHNNLIPPTGTFEGVISLSITLVRGEAFTIEGDHASIELHGQPRFVEKIP